MKKFLGILGILIVGVVVASIVVWVNRANIAAHYISRHLNVPVSLNALEISKEEAHLEHLWIGNPPHSKTQTSFAAETIDIDGTLPGILGDPLIIDEIYMENIFVGIEYYGSSKEATNWSYILESDPSKGKSGKDYLIRTLIMENLTVEITQADGKFKRYPTIQRLELKNISSETGFPVEEIEKAIFDLMMQDLIQRLNLDQLLKSIPGGNPLKYLPGLFSQKGSKSKNGAKDL